jgi:hypothetical protein
MKTARCSYSSLKFHISLFLGIVTNKDYILLCPFINSVCSCHIVLCPSLLEYPNEFLLKIKLKFITNLHLCNYVWGNRRFFVRVDIMPLEAIQLCTSQFPIINETRLDNILTFEVRGTAMPCNIGPCILVSRVGRYAMKMPDSSLDDWMY